MLDDKKELEVLLSRLDQRDHPVKVWADLGNKKYKYFRIPLQPPAKAVSVTLGWNIIIFFHHVLLDAATSQGQVFSILKWMYVMGMISGDCKILRPCITTSLLTCGRFYGMDPWSARVMQFVNTPSKLV